MDPIVFLPGAGGCASFWRPVADRLADLGPTILFAWPGFGDSPADPTLDSLDALYGWFHRRLPQGKIHVIAQSMGGVLGARLALEDPTRLGSLCLCATSGGVDVAALGGEDWRPAYRAELPDIPDWFVTDQTDLTHRLGQILARTLILVGDADPICPPSVGELLRERIPHARLERIVGGQHDFAHTLPDQVANLLRSHLYPGNFRVD
jgi:pimeloyl-ACP methyl ester carboxylesterase